MNSLMNSVDIISFPSKKKRCRHCINVKLTLCDVTSGLTVMTGKKVG